MPSDMLITDMNWTHKHTQNLLHLWVGSGDNK